jgi:lipopolysaccharide export LptBFGC system permease protein LptF
VGVIALLMAVEKVRWLVLVPAEFSQEVLLGIELQGRVAWTASILLAVLLAWISAGSFRRRRQVIWVAIGYCLYLGLAYCLWLMQYSSHGTQTTLISGALFLAFMLAMCRFLFDRRDQFDQD